ncbi:MAG: hypothetical protein ACD_37C00089G0002 [uncultured bacterium]|nr:MAG: hypothetical protein ACD_37C00089G0002 [uncultured bacterium]
MGIKFKNDNYRRVRGYSRFLEIKCASCGHFICHYQKDGPGILKRMYVDRIIGLDLNKSRQIVCKNCKNIVGNLTIYEKENRPAYNVFPGSISKKIVKSILL